MPLGNHTKTRQRCYSLIMSMILVGFSGSFAPYPFSALEGCHDGDVISMTRLPVNNPNPCNAIRMCCERRALSQKTDDFAITVKQNASKQLIFTDSGKKKGVFLYTKSVYEIGMFNRHYPK